MTAGETARERVEAALRLPNAGHIMVPTADLSELLRISQPAAGEDEDRDRRAKVVTALLAMHEKMFRRVQSGKPYPVSVACGNSDLQNLLGAVVELERATSVIAALRTPVSQPTKDDAEGDHQ